MGVSFDKRYNRGYNITLGVEEAAKIMGSDDKGGFRVVIVGYQGGQFVQDIASLLSKKGTEYIIIPDVYCAAGELVTNTQQKMLLIIGGLEEFSPENFRFLSLATELGHLCCCFIRNDSTYSPQKIAAVEQTGTALIKKVDDIEHIIDSLKGGKACKKIRVPQKEAQKNTTRFSDEKYKITEMELTALLENQ